MRLRRRRAPRWRAARDEAAGKARLRPRAARAPPVAARRAARRRGPTAAQAMAASGAAVLLKPSRGMHGTVFLAGGRDVPADPLPKIMLAGEHYNLIARLLERKIPVQAARQRAVAVPRAGSQLVQRPGRDPGHRSGAEGSGGDARRASRLVAHGHRRDRQRRRLGRRHGGVPNSQGHGAHAQANVAAGLVERRRAGLARRSRLRARASRWRCQQAGARPPVGLLQHRSGQGADLRLVSREQRRA